MNIVDSLSKPFVGGVRESIGSLCFEITKEGSRLYCRAAHQSFIKRVIVTARGVRTQTFNHYW
ncbi:hypothetical protein D3C72_1435540 [compost metagenome]